MMANVPSLADNQTHTYQADAGGGSDGEVNWGKNTHLIGSDFLQYATEVRQAKGRINNGVATAQDHQYVQSWQNMEKQARGQGQQPAPAQQQPVPAQQPAPVLVNGQWMIPVPQQQPVAQPSAHAAPYLQSSRPKLTF